MTGTAIVDHMRISRAILSLAAIQLSFISARAGDKSVQSLQLVGVSVSGPRAGDISLLFYDANSRQTYHWKHIGDQVGAATIAGYARSAETAILETKTGEIRVRLIDSTIRKAVPLTTMIPITVTVSGGGTAFKSQSVNLQAGRLVVLDLGGGKHLEILPEIAEDGNYHYTTSLYEDSADATHHKLSEPTIVTRPGGSFGFKVDDISFSATGNKAASKPPP